MSNENDRNSKKTKLIVVSIVVPTIVALAVLVGLKIIPTTVDSVSTEQIKSYDKLFFNQVVRVNATGLFGKDKSVDDEIHDVLKIFQSIDLKCYNVDWYGFNGQQIFPLSAMEDIDVKLDRSINRIQFYSNTIVMKYLEVHCPHITIDQANKLGANYDPSIGISAYDACTKAKWDERYCTALQDPKL